MTYKVQIDDVVRDATEQEIALIETIQTTAVAQQEIAANAETMRASALAKLANIGLTADEIKALVG